MNTEEAIHRVVQSAKQISRTYNNVVSLSLANTPGAVMWDGPSRPTHVSVEEDTFNVSDSQNL
jgi:hypothetical protein